MADTKDELIEKFVVLSEQRQQENAYVHEYEKGRHDGLMEAARVLTASTVDAWTDEACMYRAERDAALKKLEGALVLLRAFPHVPKEYEYLGPNAAWVRAKETYLKRIDAEKADSKEGWNG